MIVFKKRAEKERLLIEKLEIECEEKNKAEQWKELKSSCNRYKLYKLVWEVSYYSGSKYSTKQGEIGWAIRKNLLDEQSKCSLTDIRCNYAGDCRVCVEPVVSKIITFK